MATSTCAEDGVAYSLVCGLGYITLFEFHHVDPWGCAAADWHTGSDLLTLIC